MPTQSCSDGLPTLRPETNKRIYDHHVEDVWIQSALSFRRERYV